jgi:hypothetical protein
MPELRYAVGGPDGWLRIKRESAGEIISVPEHLQVELTSSGAGRDYVTVLEGVHRGKKFWWRPATSVPGARRTKARRT